MATLLATLIGLRAWVKLTMNILAGSMALAGSLLLALDAQNEPMATADSWRGIRPCGEKTYAGAA